MQRHLLGGPGGAELAAAGGTRRQCARGPRPIAPNLPGKDFRTLQQLVDKSVSPRRFVVLLLGGFALFALLWRRSESTAWSPTG
jgi:hypothetical protein